VWFRDTPGAQGLQPLASASHCSLHGTPWLLVTICGIVFNWHARRGNSCHHGHSGVGGPQRTSFFPRWMPIPLLCNLVHVHRYRRPVIKAPSVKALLFYLWFVPPRRHHAACTAVQRAGGIQPSLSGERQGASCGKIMRMSSITTSSASYGRHSRVSERLPRGRVRETSNCVTGSIQPPYTVASELLCFAYPNVCRGPTLMEGRPIGHAAPCRRRQLRQRPLRRQKLMWRRLQFWARQDTLVPRWFAFALCTLT
jgi:hypothetical protein